METESYMYITDLQLLIFCIVIFCAFDQIAIFATFKFEISLETYG
jgi:hypothetical protein